MSRAHPGKKPAGGTGLAGGVHALRICLQNRPGSLRKGKAHDPGGAFLLPFQRLRRPLGPALRPDRSHHDLAR